MESKTFNVELELRQGYAFDVTFDDAALGTLLIDEPAPLGESAGPNASRVLAAAVGHCLSASLLFCLRKAHVDVESMKTSVEGETVRNERGRLRLGSLRVKLEPSLSEPAERSKRCLDIFEDFCVVTESVRQGIDVGVEVVQRQAGS